MDNEKSPICIYVMQFRVHSAFIDTVKLNHYPYLCIDEQLNPTKTIPGIRGQIAVTLCKWNGSLMTASILTSQQQFCFTPQYLRNVKL